MARSLSSPSSSNQNGAILVVALVLLAAISIVGVSNMQSSTVELKMISAQKIRHENFTAAEALLTESENNLSSLDLIRDNLFSDKCANTESKICFTKTCSNGFCFDGNYTSSSLDELYCEVASGADQTQRAEYWEDEATWSASNSFHQVVELNVNGQQVEGKYIAEFLCFLGKNIYNDPATGDALFRVSMLYEPEYGQSILLQSTYSFEINR